MLLFKGYRVSVWDGEKVPEMDSGDEHATLWMYLMPLNCKLRIIKVVNFILCIVFHNKMFFLNSKKLLL